MYAQPFFFLAVTHWALARALRARAAVWSWGHVISSLLLLALADVGVAGHQKKNAEQSAEQNAEQNAEQKRSRNAERSV